MTVPNFRPVIMGSDLGVYSLARAFHEAYGVTSLVVSNSPRGPIMNSSIIETRFAGAGAAADEVIALLAQIADEHASSTLLLLPTAEHELDLVGEHWDELSALYVIPYSPPEVMRRSRDKRMLDEVCAELGLPVPRGVQIDLAGADHDGWTPPTLDLTYPVVLKPANSGVHTQLSFPGKRKVYLANGAREVQSVLEALIAAGYRDPMVVQELVPGDDTWGRTVTCYIDQSGRITLMASGQLLLGMHSPTMIGNSVAVLTEPQDELTEQAEQIVAKFGLRGFVNFDLKIDERDGEARFFDLNARIGRPNHYLLVAGVNPAIAIVEDHLLDGPGRVQRHNRVGVYSYLPRLWLNRYLPTGLRRRVAIAWRRTKPGPDPLVYRADRHPRRWLYRMMATVNLIRSYRRFYPRPTQTGI